MLRKSGHFSAIWIITSSFKTAPTESFIRLSNLLPFDLNILEIATLCYFATPANECFCISFRNYILNCVPFDRVSHSWMKAHLPDLPLEYFSLRVLITLLGSPFATECFWHYSILYPCPSLSRRGWGLCVLKLTPLQFPRSRTGPYNQVFPSDSVFAFPCLQRRALYAVSEDKWIL